MFLFLSCKLLRNPCLQVAKICVPSISFKIEGNHTNSVSIEATQNDMKLSVTKGKKKIKKTAPLLPHISNAHLKVEDSHTDVANIEAGQDGTTISSTKGKEKTENSVPLLPPSSKAHLQVEDNHTDVASTEAGQDDTKISSTKGKKKAKKSVLLLPRISKERLKTIQTISSIVISSQELSFVIMNHDCILQNLVTIPFPKITRSTRHAYYDLLYPLIEFQSKVDLNIIERHVLPPKYDLINLHIKAVVMLLIGMFEEDLSNRRVTFACRKQIGKLFELNIEKTESRKCSKALATDIVKRQFWNDRYVEIPERLLTERDDAIYYTERLIHKLKKSRLSPEGADALIQAVGFWDYAQKVLS